MRTFTSEDGKNWVARIHDGMAEKSSEENRIGWEVIQFDTEPGGNYQRITYRPSGWLSNATLQELIDALKEGESVRAAWK